MNWYESLPQDIIEYISKKLYNDFANKIKKKYQIKKDAIFASELLARERLQNYYINNVYNFYNNNYNSTMHNYIINNINHNYNNNIINDNIIYNDYDSTDSEMPDLEPIQNNIYN